MAWISAVNMDALSGKRHFRVWVRDTQADATFGPFFLTVCIYILKIWILRWQFFKFCSKDEWIRSFLFVCSKCKCTSGCFIVQGGILSIELDWIFRTVIPAEFRAGAFRIPNVGIALGDNLGTNAQHSHPSKGGARWLSGRVSDSGARGPGFETYRRRVVSLSKTLYSPKVLVNYPGSDGSVPIWLKNCWLGR